MKGLIISALAAAYLYGASEPYTILGDVSKLRQKYEECRQGQSSVLGIEPKRYQQCETERRDANGKLKGYQSRILNLETQIQENNSLLTRLQTQNRDMSRELSQKQGVIKSLEQTLTSRDKHYRDVSARYELLSENTNTAKVSKIERESLKNALVRAKADNERLEKELKKIVSLRPGNDANAKLQAMQTELLLAQSTITRLQGNPAQSVIQGKVVYKERPVIQEKIVTKVVEPTEKLQALRSELANAQTTIANFKNGSGTKVVYKDRIVTQEKIVYKDRPVVQEKVVYKDRIVTQEKVVYKDRPVIEEKIVTKVVEPTEKIKALQHELVNAQATIVNLKNSPAKVVIKEKIVPQEKIVYKDRIVTQEKIVYKDRPVIQEKIVTKVVEPTEKLQALRSELAASQATIMNLKNTPAKVVIKEKIVPQEKVVYKDRIITQEKVVYKDRPIEKIVTKVDEATRTQMDKLALDRERQKSVNQKLSKAAIPVPSKRTPVIAATVPKVTKITAKSVAAAQSVKQVSTPPESKPAASVSTPKKVGASVYRMATNAPIYNSQGGAQVNTWEARRSFTAGLPSGGWVHITGYFVNRVWQSTRDDENLWVKESDVIRR